MGTSGRQLKSELARICLPAPHAHNQRNLAWANSICLLFLIIGLAGFRPAPPPLIIVKHLEEPAPVVIEAPPPPPSVTELKPEDVGAAAAGCRPAAGGDRRARFARHQFAVPTPGGTLVAPKMYPVTPPAAGAGGSAAAAKARPTQPPGEHRPGRRTPGPALSANGRAAWPAGNGGAVVDGGRSGPYHFSRGQGVLRLLDSGSRLRRISSNGIGPCHRARAGGFFRRESTTN